MCSAERVRANWKASLTMAKRSARRRVEVSEGLRALRGGDGLGARLWSTSDMRVVQIAPAGFTWALRIIFRLR